MASADLDALQESDRAMSMGYVVNLACSVELGKLEDRGLDTLKGQLIEQVQDDQMRAHVEQLVEELGTGPGR